MAKKKQPFRRRTTKPAFAGASNSTDDADSCAVCQGLTALARKAEEGLILFVQKGVDKLIPCVDKIIVLRGRVEQALDREWETHMPIPRSELCQEHTEEHAEELVMEYIQSIILPGLFDRVKFAENGVPVTWPQFRRIACHIVWPEWGERWDDEDEPDPDGSQVDGLHRHTALHMLKDKLRPHH